MKADRDLVYCIRGNLNKCHKHKECQRSGNEYLVNDPYVWWFSGCDNNDNGNADLFYFIPKIN